MGWGLDLKKGLLERVTQGGWQRPTANEMGVEKGSCKGGRGLSVQRGEVFVWGGGGGRRR